MAPETFQVTPLMYDDAYSDGSGSPRVSSEEGGDRCRGVEGLMGTVGRDIGPTSQSCPPPAITFVSALPRRQDQMVVVVGPDTADEGDDNAEYPPLNGRRGSAVPWMARRDT